MSEVKTVAFIGLGTMGRPMARNIQRGGFTVRAFDVSPEAVAALVEAGATAAASAAEAARGADCVITMLPTGRHVEEAVFGPDGIAEAIGAEAIYVDMSTIAPADTDRIMGRLRERGIATVDAPVGRLSIHAEQGKLLIMAGGEAEDVARVRPVFDLMGDTIIHCGPVGSGSRMKIVNNFMSITLNATTAEALTLAEASGLDPELARTTMLGTAAGLGHMGSTYPAKVLKGDLSPGFMIDLALKDLRLALDLGRSLDLPLKTGAAAEAAYEGASGRGRGREDWTAIYADAKAGLSPKN